MISAAAASAICRGSMTLLPKTSLLSSRSTTLLLASATTAHTPITLPTPSGSTLRTFSSYSFDRVSSSDRESMLELQRWPMKRMNTILNIVPQGQQHVVERFGKLHTIEQAGWFLAIPFLDEISYIVDLRERAIDIPPQATITRDNVSVDVSGNLFVAFVDAERAAYGARNPLYAVMTHAQSAMRSAIGEMELDEILHNRSKLNTLIKGAIQESAINWGMEIRRYEITEVTPDAVIRHAMDKQAAAERARRELVLQAEGEKRRAELTSEGTKIKLVNESEGSLIKSRNEAEARKVALVAEAEGEALSVKMRAEAQAEAIRKVAEALSAEGGWEAARLALAQEYVEMYGEMGKQSNTMLFSDRPADINSLLAQATLAIKGANDAAASKPSQSAPVGDTTPTQQDQ